MGSYLLAHDVGTSGNKATLFSTDGTLIGSHTVTYPTHYFNGNWAEQEPADWWQAICESTQALTWEVDAADIACVTLSGQMMGCTPVDRNGRALRPSLLYCDQRATTQAAQLLDALGLPAFYAITGHRISPCYTLAKLMWLRDHEPEVFNATYKTLCAKDYINFRLTGFMATDYSDASGTNAFDLNTRRWSAAVLAAAGLDGGLFPEVRESTAILGEVTREAAHATGLRTGTPVAVGGGDGSCAGVGVGCIRPGKAYNYLGSSSWIALTTEKPIIDPQMRTMNWAHCVPGYLHPSGTMQAAGASFEWLKKTLCHEESQAAAATAADVYDLINREIEKSPVGARGLLFLPYMLGERTPRWNPDAKGAFIGLSLATQREDILRAVMEGITMNLALIVGIFRQHVPIPAITVIGGGAKGEVWRQMMADLYDCPIETLNVNTEATSMGAAVIGGVAAGVFRDFDVIDRFVRVTGRVEPKPENQEVYRRLLPIFDASYDALTGIYAKLAQGEQ